MVAALTGDADRAMGYGDRAIQYSAPRGEQWAKAYAHYALTIAKWLKGDVDAALREAADCVRITLKFNDITGFVMVAAQLTISPRTVDVHVDHILRKLGFTSRVQIAAWVAQSGT